MNPTTFHRRRAERFAQLLEEADGGRRHHVRSRLDARLAELVAIGHQACTLRPTVELDPEFRTGLRALLVATAEREGIGHGAQEPAEPERASAPLRSATVSGRPSRARTRGAVIIGVAVGAIAVSGMSAASENAVPGDALYGVKRSTERAQLALASSDVTRGQLYLDFAHTRVAEAAAVRRDGSGLAGVLDDMDGDTRQGVRLLTTSAAVRRDPAALDAVDSFLAVQRTELSDLLGQVPDANRARMLESLALLDAVSRRADGLRPTLSCGDVSGSGSDALGPRPRQCGAVPGPNRDQTRRERPSGVDESATHRRTETASTAEPTPRGPAKAPTADDALPEQPAVSGAPAQPAAPATAPPAPEEDGVLGEVGRILGGLLG